MKGLDLSKFEKVSEDKDTVVMKHPKGHTITIAMKALPKLHQEQFKRLKMSDGGEVKPSPTPQPKNPPIDKQAATDVQESFKKALGFDDGGNVPEDGKSTSQPAANITINTSPAQGPSQQSSQPVPVQMPQSPNPQNPLLPDGSMSAPAAAQAGVQGARLGQQIEAEKAKALVPQEQQYIDQTAQLNQNYTNNINELKQHANDLAEFTKQNPINEKAYLENMGAGRKMATALGLILSGAGAGASGGPNIAYDYLNKQIDRNIQAQKDRYGQHQTVWGAYKDLYNDEGVADSMARAHALDMLTHQAAQTAARFGTPTAAKGYLDYISKAIPERNKAILDSAGSLNSIPMNVPHGTSPITPANAPMQPDNQNPEKGSMLGAPGAEASKPKGLIEPDEYADSPILNKNAQEKLDQLRYTPKAKDEIDQIKTQYTAAQQADAILGQLHKVHQQLFKDAKSGGYFRRHDPTEHIPIIGSALSRAVVQPLTDNPTNRDYESNRTRIVSDIANSLHGANIPGEEVERIVSANLPEHGDTPELVAKKERAIRLFIKNNVNKSLLKDWDLTK